VRSCSRCGPSRRYTHRWGSEWRSSPTTVTRTSDSAPTHRSYQTSRSSPATCARRRPNAPPSRLRLESEAERVLADGDHVAAGQLLFDDRIAVDLRPVGAAEVADPERALTDLDPSVVARRRRVADDDVIVRRAAKADHLVWQGDDAAGERARFEGEQGREACARGDLLRRH